MVLAILCKLNSDSLGSFGAEPADPEAISKFDNRVCSAFSSQACIHGHNSGRQH